MFGLSGSGGLFMAAFSGQNTVCCVLRRDVTTVVIQKNRETPGSEGFRVGRWQMDITLAGRRNVASFFIVVKRHNLVDKLNIGKFLLANIPFCRKSACFRTRGSISPPLIYLPVAPGVTSQSENLPGLFQRTSAV